MGSQLNQSTAHAAVDTNVLEKVLNGLVTPKLVNGSNKPQLSDRNQTNEVIDPATGTLSLNETDLSLPGKDGLNLNLARYYNSSQAEVGTKRVSVTSSTSQLQGYGSGYYLTILYYNNSTRNYETYVPGYYSTYNQAYEQSRYYDKQDSNGRSFVSYSIDYKDVLYTQITYTTTTTVYPDENSYSRLRYDLGGGWSFAFPSLQIEGGYVHYHNGSGGAYVVKFDGSNRGTLEDYGRTDVALLYDSGYSNGQMNSTYVFVDETQNKTYFGSDGRLLGVRDLLGNEIKFTHINRNMNGRTYPVISNIVDTIGRNISFNYETKLNDPNFDTQNMTENITVTVTHPSTNEKITLTYAKKREGVSKFENGNLISKWYEPYLFSVKDTKGYSTYYDYYLASEKFDATSKYLNNSAGTAVYLLKYAMYPHSTSFYQYNSPVTRNWGADGAYQGFQVSNRWDSLNIYEYDKPNPQIAGRGLYNGRDYTYFGDVTGYPTYYSEESIPESYRFGSEVVNNDQVRTKYTFNGKKQLLTTEQTAKNGEKSVETVQSYDSNFKYKPTRIENKTISGSRENNLYTLYQYYNWGDIQTQTQPLTSSQLNNTNQLKENTMSYEYDPTLKLPTKKQFYQNASALLTETFTYDTQGRLKTSQNANGEITTVNYSTSASGKTEEVTKQLENGKTAKSISFYSQTSYQLFPTSVKNVYTNDSGLLIESENKQTYNVLLGVVTSTTDADNKTIQYQYDAYGRLAKTIYPVTNNQSGQLYQVEDVIDYQDQTVDNSPNYFDSENKYLITTRVDGYTKTTRRSDNAVSYDNVTHSFYDGFGNLVLQGQFDGVKNSELVMAQYHYDIMARPEYVVDTKGNTSTVKYDTWGRAFETIDPFGNLYRSDVDIIDRSNTSYLVAANDISTFRSNPTNNLKKNVLQSYSDAWGREVTRKAYPNWPSMNVVVEGNYEYDDLSNMIGYTDPNRRRTSYAYDKLNRLISTTDPLNQTTSYAYNTLGNLKSTTQSDGASTWVTAKDYDETGFLKSNADANNSKDIFTRNVLGQISTRKDANNNLINYVYDETGRTIIKNVNNTQLKNEYQFRPFGPAVQREYRNGSNIKNVVNDYDILGNQKYKRVVYNAVDATVLHQYDYQSRLLNVTDPFNFMTQYAYDKTRINRVQTNGLSVMNTSDSNNAKYEYEADGKLKSVTYPTLSNGIVIKSENSYDSIGRLLKVTNRKGTEILSEFQYSYDNNGNILSVTDKTGTTSYQYDVLNRLTKTTRPTGQAISYTYDVRGNRSTVASADLVQSYSDITATYNEWDQLKTSTNNGITTNYDYELQGLRLTKNTDSSSTNYAYNNSGQIISESNASNQVTANYVWGPDRLLAKKDVAASQNYYYIYNGHGDVVQIIDASGQVTNKYQYDEWGNILTQEEKVPNSFKYAGEYQDEETGYYYLRSRYYDPSDGRFISKDSYEGQISNPLSMNQYTYVHNNPLRYFDPSGHRIDNDKNLTKVDQKLIDQYTNDFNNAKKAGNKTAMQIAHNNAVNVRLGSGNYEQVRKTDYTTGKFTDITVHSGSAREDWLSTSLAVPALAAGIFYAPIVAPTVFATADVATMGTTLSTGTVIAAQAINTSSKVVTLYRSMNESELVGIAKTNAFDDGFNMSGKWFATNFEDASKWGAVMGGNPRIVSMTIPKSMLESAYYSKKLDNIGPAYYFELDLLNSGFGKVTVVK